MPDPETVEGNWFIPGPPNQRVLIPSLEVLRLSLEYIGYIIFRLYEDASQPGGGASGVPILEKS